MSKEIEDPRETSHHPRKRLVLAGHAEAEQMVLRRIQAERLHHAWLLAGPRGIGKATFAYRVARFLLDCPEPDMARTRADLSVTAESHAAHWMSSGSHPSLHVVERVFDPKNGRLKGEIGVDDARKISGFFSRTAGDGGWRVAIIDAADDLNGESANALLKILEEPPRRSLFLLISNHPGRLLPTIRSRCLRLDLKPLDIAQTCAVLADVLPDAENPEKLARLSNGSPGLAMTLATSDGARLFESFAERMARTGTLDAATRIGLADEFQARTMADDFDIFCDLLLAWIAERARAENSVHFARIHAEIGHSIREANALNLDRRQTILAALRLIGDSSSAA
ncbi:DNA polymerase III subunit delta' [soil metagenome]